MGRVLGKRVGDELQRRRQPNVELLADLTPQHPGCRGERRGRRLTLLRGTEHRVEHGRVLQIARDAHIGDRHEPAPRVAQPFAVELLFDDQPRQDVLPEEAQRATVRDCEVEILPGLIAGQRQIPVSAAGCYVPGGRYSHVASAIMTITTAKVAGVPHVTACSPPRPGVGIPPAIVYAMDLCGADVILSMGGVQGVAAMANGLFGLPRADMLVGPGNQYVAEAKRILFGRVGIDMFAGPTDSMVVADGRADSEMVAADLVGQAEHGYNSPVWLVTSDRALAERVMARVPELIATLPDANRQSATAAWADYAEVILCADAEEMALSLIHI